MLTGLALEKGGGGAMRCFLCAIHSLFCLVFISSCNVFYSFTCMSAGKEKKRCYDTLVVVTKERGHCKQQMVGTHCTRL